MFFNRLQQTFSNKKQKHFVCYLETDKMQGAIKMRLFEKAKNYAEKEVPQPQVSEALGLLNVNPLLLRPS